MPWRDDFVPRRMARVAVVAPQTRWRDVLVEVADAGVVEPERAERPSTALTAAIDSAGRPRHAVGEPTEQPRLQRGGLDLERSVSGARWDLISGEAELDRVTGASVARDGVRAVAGWAPSSEVPGLADRVASLGGAVVELVRPPGVDPPTLLGARRGVALRPLVDTYATVPYRDVDPNWFAIGAYVVMFGMMFGDVGDGALLILAGLWLHRTRRAPLDGVRWASPLVIALGVASAVFGLLYGECFGPTGVVPTLWLRPLDDPTRLLGVGVGVGAVLLAIAYALGVVNRWREGGIGLALYAPTGLAGAALFLGLGLVAGGIVWHRAWLWTGGLLLAVAALGLLAVGLRAAAGPGAAGAMQASVELFDVVIRLGSNIVSFARLAAFGLTHAALSEVVWNATRSTWGAKPTVVVAVLVFVVGHSIAFGLEGLVAGVQALRLEYYELFSRIFSTEGRPFRPWHIPTAPDEEPR